MKIQAEQSRAEQGALFSSPFILSWWAHDDLELEMYAHEKPFIVFHVIRQLPGMPGPVAVLAVGPSRSITDGKAALPLSLGCRNGES